MSSEPRRVERREAERVEPFHPPFDAASLAEFLAQRAIPGVEASDGHSYRRAVRLAHGDGVLIVHLPALAEGARSVRVETHVADGRDHGEAVGLARRLFDLDADSATIDGSLGEDPIMASLVARRPGVRIPGAVDPHELLVRAIIGQQISVAGARTVAARLAERHGEPLTIADPTGRVTRHFPRVGALAAVDPEQLPMPRARGRCLVGACRALDEGTVSIAADADPLDVRRQLTALAGIGPWTADYVIWRCLGAPDVFLPTDLGVRHAVERLGMASDPRSIAELAHRWQPYRSYALMHLWLSLG